MNNIKDIIGDFNYFKDASGKNKLYVSKFSQSFLYGKMECKFPLKN